MGRLDGTASGVSQGVVGVCSDVTGGPEPSNIAIEAPNAKKAEAPGFNEQTNYVSTGKIIMVDSPASNKLSLSTPFTRL